MNTVRKIFGIVWIVMAPVAAYFLITNAIEALAKANKGITAASTEAARAAAEAAKTNTSLQWGIIIVIFIPIGIGLIIFGKYAVSGEYDLGTAGQ